MRAFIPLVKFFHVLLTSALFSLTGLSELDGSDEAGRIRIGPNRLVSSARKDTAHYEVVVACDPTDVRRLVIASMASASPSEHSLHEVATFVSTDGGIDWEVTKILKGQRANESFFDPHLTFGPDGSVYLVAFSTVVQLSNAAAPRIKAEEANLGAVEVLRSADSGRTWGPRTSIKSADRPFLLADHKTPGALHCFAVKHSPVAAVSRDGGKSFTNWNPIVKIKSYSMGNPAMLSDGTLLAPYPVLRGGGGRLPSPVTLTVARSADGALSYDTSTVADYTFADNGLPSLAVDATRAGNKDHLYIVWPDASGGQRRVFFSRSIDGAKKWAQPTLLSEQIDEGESPKRHHAYLPSVAVNRAGVVGVSWYDTRDLPEKKEGWNIRFRCSLDGGQTWLPSQRVTDQDSILSDDAHWSAKWTGDTAGLAVDANGIFHAVWVDNRSGLRQLRTSEISVVSRTE